MFHYGKLDSSGKITEVVTSEERIEDGHHVFLSAEDGFDGSSYVGRSWPRPAVSWRSVTRRQGRQQLLASGLLDSTEDAIDAIEDETQRAMIRIWYEDAAEWDRDNEAITALASSLGLSEDEIDALFKEAAKR